MTSTKRFAPGQYITLHLDIPYTVEELMDAVNEVGRAVKKTGVGPGSLESEDTAGLDYVVLIASDIQTHLPKLWDLYTSPYLIESIAQAVGEPVEHKESNDAININFVHGGGRYELHVDSEPYTLLVFLNTLEERDGGRLCVYQSADTGADGDCFTPLRGMAVLFDGSISPHGVTPTDVPRLTMPMVYAPVERRTERANSDTDAYLYDE